MKPLLIVANTPSDNTLTLRESVVRGAQHTGLAVIAKPPLQTTATDVLGCSGVLIGTTENFGYMSGQIKDFFERVYSPCLNHCDALPWALYVKAGLDGTGATRSVEKIAKGLKWKAVQAPLLLHGPYQEDFSVQCETLGAAMAEGLLLEIF